RQGVRSRPSRRIGFHGRNKPGGRTKRSARNGRHESWSGKWRRFLSIWISPGGRLPDFCSGQARGPRRNRSIHSPPVQLERRLPFAVPTAVPARKNAFFTQLAPHPADQESRL